jgi:hypothetical protein
MIIRMRTFIAKGKGNGNVTVAFDALGSYHFGGLRMASRPLIKVISSALPVISLSCFWQLQTDH